MKATIFILLMLTSSCSLTKEYYQSKAFDLVLDFIKKDTTIQSFMFEDKDKPLCFSLDSSSTYTIFWSNLTFILENDYLDFKTRINESEDIKKILAKRFNELNELEERRKLNYVPINIDISKYQFNCDLIELKCSFDIINNKVFHLYISPLDEYFLKYKKYVEYLIILENDKIIDYKVSKGYF